MTNADVHSALVRWLAGLTGATVIKAHQSGKAPAHPYIMVNMMSVSEVRQNAQEDEYEEDVEGNVKASPVIETEWSFSVHAYGPSPTDLLRPIRAAAQLAQKNEPLMPGLVVHEVSALRNVPDWVNNAWEPRAQVDLYMRGLVRDGFVIDTIEEYAISFTSDRS